MRVPAKLAVVSAALCALCSAFALRADEIRLKDGKKLYGVIVAYEDNMFKVKTDFGFVLVEKDKIASIVPSGPPGPSTNAPTKPVKGEESGVAESAGAKPRLPAEPIRPSLPVPSATQNAAAPNLKPATPASAPTSSAVLTTAAKEPDPPANKESVQGTLYTNFSHGFRMYKAPSWELIEDARQALPNAIVAMGTSNESTLMVVGQEALKDSLDACANSVEKRLREIYENYHMLSRRRTVVGGAPSVEFKYTGHAEAHEWSGTLVVVSRGKDVLTILGMTYADSDLIQIQENVIARAIASTDFNVH